MPSSREYLDFILEQLGDLDGVAHRAMMGEFLIYYRGRLAGGIYDDRLLVKPVAAARALLPGVPLEAPYEGAKGMLPVHGVDDRAFLKGLFEAMYDELPGRSQRPSKNPGDYQGVETP